MSDVQQEKEGMLKTDATHYHSVRTSMHSRAIKELVQRCTKITHWGVLSGLVLIGFPVRMYVALIL